jgi:hypothetical protein
MWLGPYGPCTNMILPPTWVGPIMNSHFSPTWYPARVSPFPSLPSRRRQGASRLRRRALPRAPRPDLAAPLPSAGRAGEPLHHVPRPALAARTRPSPRPKPPRTRRDPDVRARRARRAASSVCAALLTRVPGRSRPAGLRPGSAATPSSAPGVRAAPLLPPWPASSLLCPPPLSLPSPPGRGLSPLAGPPSPPLLALLQPPCVGVTPVGPSPLRAPPRPLRLWRMSFLRGLPVRRTLPRRWSLIRLRSSISHLLHRPPTRDTLSPLSLLPVRSTRHDRPACGRRPSFGSVSARPPTLSLLRLPRQNSSSPRLRPTPAGSPPLTPWAACTGSRPHRPSEPSPAPSPRCSGMTRLTR